MTPAKKLLLELVAIPSVNPAFLPPNDPRAGEQGMADFLSATAAVGGLDIHFQQVFPSRSNLLASLIPPGKARGHVILAPHLDTVGHPELPGGMFQPREKNGRVYGRGACDTKGSCAAMMSALLEVARSGRRPSQTAVTFAGLVDEEHSQAGARALGKHYRANFAIVGEPTRLKVVTAHKGNLWLKLETRGVAAHGARPELGQNAVHEMARIVDLLETVYSQSLLRRKHPLLGPATISVGVISGGTQPNIVPDHCAIQVDRRTLPGETESGVLREMKKFLSEHQLEARITSIKSAPCLPLETDPKIPLARQFLELAGEKKGAGVDFFCDAAVLAGQGIPSVVFGPGDISQAHTSQEWISIRELEQATRLLVAFLRSLP
jgi:acetylornithine deacetylase/succinyl-diaminopimelate desuccinylase-like protein